VTTINVQTTASGTKAITGLGLSIVADVFTDPALVEQALADFGTSGGPGDPADDGRSPATLAPPRAIADPTGL